MFDILFEQIHSARIEKYIKEKGWLWWVSLVGALSGFVFLTFITNEVWDFPEHHLVHIPEGASSREIAFLLEEAGVVTSHRAIDMALFLRFGTSNVKAGDYFFEFPQGPWHIAGRLIIGEYGLTPQRVVIPEGSTVRDMALLFERSLDGLFNAEEFIEKAEPKEGYLFPDTYFFLPNATADIVIAALERNFEKNVALVQEEIDAFGQPLHSIVVMASLLEKEARQLETKQMIAGVLWNRIAIDMALQVDAVFPYIIGKNTFEVTLEDLKNESPYNTYVHKGLPPGAIANPGLDSLLAAVTPTESEYLFYLADMNGVTHYAETFDEHIVNRRRYLP